VLINSNIINAELQLNNGILKKLTLWEIEQLLQNNIRTLKQFQFMAYPDGFVTTHYGNRFIYSELDYNVREEYNLFQMNFNYMTGKSFLST